MRIMTRISLGRFYIILLFLLSINYINAQGCVAIRHFSCSSGNNLESNLLGKGSFQLGMKYRYFKSFRHFRGTEQEKDRVSNNTEVINHSHAWDINLNYGITDRLFAGITIPTVINSRSSLYEHGREERHLSFSRGLADIRVGVGYWLFDPIKNPSGNMSVGIGFKLPTGKYNASDIFYNVGPDGTPQVRPVDQSIQPGDGGFGITVDLQFYRSITENLFVYGGGFYLFNPKETNEIRTFRETLSPILENESITSVPDQFAVRAGMGLSFTSIFSASLGARYEGVPVEDVIGGSSGFRRPGTVLSIDPGVGMSLSNFSFNVNVPFAVRRERPQSVTDLETQAITGEYRHGDAAFADYLINVGISYTFNNKPVVRVKEEHKAIFD
ncbi:hypothetical protein [Galbibacter sp.]|uniref:hypothetical protein n=1 Tax=Galbibacter sp. TaxID=2918471 RepID=UPI003A8E5565